IQVVELRPNLEVLTLRIALVDVDPRQGLADLPLRGRQHVGVFDIRPPPLEAVGAAAPRIGVPDGESPDVAEGIEKDRAAIDDPAALAGIRPMDAVAREMQRHDPIVPTRLRTRAAGADHAERLEASFRVFLVVIEPNRAGIATAGEDDIGALFYVKKGL